MVINNLEDFLAQHVISYFKIEEKRNIAYSYHMFAKLLGSGKVKVLPRRYERSGLWINESDYIDMKLGRYLTFAYNFTPAEITHICEKVKSILETPGNFQVIEGDAIKDAYYRVNYVPNHGTLHGSCMRYKRCQDGNYFQIYADHAKMLIMTPKRGKKIMGRALLWEYNGSYIMDRVYTIENYVEHQFYEYAKKQGWGILERNSYTASRSGSIQKWKFPDTNYEEAVEVKLRIPIPEAYKHFPFMDSFCYMDSKEEYLSTYPFTGMHNHVLQNIEGGFYYCYYAS